MMELVDMRDLGSRAAMRVGSSPFRRTKADHHDEKSWWSVLYELHTNGKTDKKGFSINRTLERYVFAGETAYTQCHLVKTLSRQPLAEQGI